MFIEPKKLRGKPLQLKMALCVINKHAPDRRAAKWDGTHYVSFCLHCGKRIRRKARDDWKLEWMEKA